MKNKKNLMVLSLVFLFAVCMLAIPPVKAAPTDNYYVRTGDWWVMTITESVSPAAPVGNMTKAIVTNVNNSQITYPIPFSFTAYGDTVYATGWIANATYPTWIQQGTETGMSVYNLTEPNLAAYGGYFGSALSCTNLTAFNISNFNQFTMYSPPGFAINVSTKVGLTFSYWNGLANGSGISTSSQKVVMTLDPTKYVVSQTQSLMWNTTSMAWDIMLESTMTSYSWSTTTPPIPGFEFLFITIAMAGIVSVYLLRKRKQIEI